MNDEYEKLQRELAEQAKARKDTADFIGKAICGGATRYAESFQDSMSLVSSASSREAAQDRAVAEQAIARQNGRIS